MGSGYGKSICNVKVRSGDVKESRVKKLNVSKALSRWMKWLERWAPVADGLGSNLNSGRRICYRYEGIRVRV